MSLLLLVLPFLGDVLLLQPSFGDFEDNFGLFVVENVLAVDFYFDMGGRGGGGGAHLVGNSTSFLDLLSGATHTTINQLGQASVDVIFKT